MQVQMPDGERGGAVPEARCSASDGRRLIRCELHERNLL